MLMDANARGIDQGFTGDTGELAYTLRRSMTLVSGDTDGDGNADFVLRLSSKIMLAETDFAL